MFDTSEKSRKTIPTSTKRVRKLSLLVALRFENCSDLQDVKLHGTSWISRPNLEGGATQLAKLLFKFKTFYNFQILIQHDVAYNFEV